MENVAGQCNDTLKPCKGDLFDSVQEFEGFYKQYAHNVGFSVRNSTALKDKNDQIQYKYFVCSKEGFKDNRNLSSQIEKGKEVFRKRSNTRVGCNAGVSIKRTDEGKYTVFNFYEEHNHELCTPRKKHFLKSNRKLTDTHKNLLSSLDRVNIGPTKAFHIMKEQVGGYENVGFTCNDVKNYARDLKAYINDSDAHMFIQNFKIQNERNPSFYYAFQLDTEDHLKHVFWADGVARNNFAIFGDLLSFDTTYNTNKYSMIFAPFTIVDSSSNKEKCRDVVHSSVNTTCSCKMFESHGIPCRHILLVLKGQGMNELPNYCIMNRWCKNATSHMPFMMNQSELVDISDNERHRRILSTTWTQLNRCVEVAKFSEDSLIDLMKNVMNWEKQMREKMACDRTPSIKNMCNEPNQIEILPPLRSNMKGSGKRLKGGREKSIEIQQKITRLCRTCGEHGLHDSRNCPKKSSI